jgi:hypothetical protein
VALHPVRAADEQHRAVQHREGALCLPGKVHVAGVSSSVISLPRQRSRACLENMVIPRARSWASVSRKASPWSTRPRRRRAPEAKSMLR